MWVWIQLLELIPLLFIHFSCGGLWFSCVSFSSAPTDSIPLIANDPNWLKWALYPDLPVSCFFRSLSGSLHLVQYGSTFLPVESYGSEHLSAIIFISPDQSHPTKLTTQGWASKVFQKVSAWAFNTTHDVTVIQATWWLITQRTVTMCVSLWDEAGFCCSKERQLGNVTIYTESKQFSGFFN